MEFNPVKIYNAFHTEWLDIYLKCPDWVIFIESKDLGIKCIESCQFSQDDKYEIVDEKKWLLNKIKYGF